MLRLFSFAALFASAVATIMDCNSNSVFRPIQLAVTPDPPVPGKEVALTLVFDYNAGAGAPPIENGTVATTVSINGMIFPVDKRPLCDETPCPIEPGTNDRSTRSIWPQVSGLVKTKLTWTGPGDEVLLCIASTFRIPHSLIHRNYKDKRVNRLRGVLYY
jgi:hypothetical protein